VSRASERPSTTYAAGVREVDGRGVAGRSHEKLSPGLKRPAGSALPRIFLPQVGISTAVVPAFRGGSGKPWSVRMIDSARAGSFAACFCSAAGCSFLPAETPPTITASSRRPAVQATPEAWGRFTAERRLAGQRGLPLAALGTMPACRECTEVREPCPGARRVRGPWTLEALRKPPRAVPREARAAETPGPRSARTARSITTGIQTTPVRGGRAARRVSMSRKRGPIVGIGCARFVARERSRPFRTRAPALLGPSARPIPI